MFVPCLLTCQEDYIRITDLVWDPDARRRDAACVFASRFVMQEDWAWGEAVFSASEAWLPPRGFKKISILKIVQNCEGHHGLAQRKCWLRSQKAGIFRR